MAETMSDPALIFHDWEDTEVAHDQTAFLGYLRVGVIQFFTNTLPQIQRDFNYLGKSLQSGVAMTAGRQR